MRGISAAWLGLTVLLAHAVEPACAEPPAGPQIVMRAGVHPGFERLVLDLPPGEPGVMTQDGSTLTLHFASQAVPVLPAGAMRNAASVRAGEGWVEVKLAAGVRLRRAQMRDRLVLDLLDKPPAEPVAGHDAPAAADTRSAQAGAVEATALPPGGEAQGSTPGPRPAAAGARLAASAVPAVVGEAAPAVRTASAAVGPAGPKGLQRRGPGLGIVRSRSEAASLSAQGAAVIANAATPGTATAPGVVAPPDLPIAAGSGEPPSRPQPDDVVALAATATGAAEPASDPTASAEAAGGGDPVAGGALLRLPFAAQTGAAAFRLGDTALLVFDERRPIDAARLRDDPRFGGLSVQLLQHGTLLTLLLPPEQDVRLSKFSGGWNVALQAGGKAAEPIRPIFTAGTVRLPVSAPGVVLSVPNPMTGGILLVGTQLAPGQGIGAARRSPALALVPSWQGVVVDPASDAVVMHAEPDAFVISGDIPGRPLAISGADANTDAMADASRLTRRFDFPPLSDSALEWRLRAATAEAAAEPPRSRTRSRLKVAEAMIALGLGAEAQALLNLTATDDPQAADDPQLVVLSAVAALLAGRVPESGALNDTRLSGSDEIALWRALRAAVQAEAAQAQPGTSPQGTAPAASSGVAPGEAPAAALALAADARLLLSYPQPLRRRLLPLAAETLALAGETHAAEALIAARPDDPSLDLARALLADRAARSGGEAATALALYDRLSESRDRLTRLRAATSAVELRLKLGQFSADQAATAMDRLVAAWRGDGRELALRLRTAFLLGEAQEWRRALALLRETAQGWPDQREDMLRRLSAMFAAALAADTVRPLAPLDLVALAEENPDLLPDGEPGRRLAARLADRLAALDLPARAIPAMARLMAATPAGPVRSEVGTRLAAWHLRNHDNAASIAALEASDSPDLGGDLLQQRMLLRARAEAASGRVPAAVAMLDHADSEEADELRASLLEQARDWAPATAALLRYAARTVPPEGPLGASQARTVLRVASAAAQASDETTLADLRARYSARLAAGEVAHLFAMLTEPPVHDATELPRAARETASARNIPTDVKSLSPLPSPAPAPQPGAEGASPIPKVAAPVVPASPPPSAAPTQATSPSPSQPQAVRPLAAR